MMNNLQSSRYGLEKGNDRTSRQRMVSPVYMNDQVNKFNSLAKKFDSGQKPIEAYN